MGVSETRQIATNCLQYGVFPLLLYVPPENSMKIPPTPDIKFQSLYLLTSSCSRKSDSRAAGETRRVNV